MAQKNYSKQMRRSSYGQNLQRKQFGDILGDITSSDQPGKWITGVGLAAMVVAGLAIKAISDNERRK